MFVCLGFFVGFFFVFFAFFVVVVVVVVWGVFVLLFFCCCFFFLGGGGIQPKRYSQPVFVDGSWLVCFCCRHPPAKDRMSGSFESVQRNACVHRLDLGLYSRPKEFWGMESEPMLTPRGKSPLPEGSKEGRIRDAASRIASPTHYRLFYSGPITCPGFSPSMSPDHLEHHSLHQ